MSNDPTTAGQSDLLSSAASLEVLAQEIWGWGPMRPSREDVLRVGDSVRAVADQLRLLASGEYGDGNGGGAAAALVPKAGRSVPPRRSSIQRGPTHV